MSPVDNGGASFPGTTSFDLGVGLTVQFAVQQTDSEGVGTGEEVFAPTVELTSDPAGAFFMTAQVGGTQLAGLPATLVEISAPAPVTGTVELRVDTQASNDFTEDLAIRALAVGRVSFEVDETEVNDGGPVALFADSLLPFRAIAHSTSGGPVVGALEVTSAGAVTASGGFLRSNQTPGSGTVTALGDVLSVDVVDVTAIDHLAFRDPYTQVSSPIDVGPSGFVTLRLCPVTASNVEILGDAPEDPSVSITGTATLVTQNSDLFIFRAETPGMSTLAFTWHGVSASLQINLAQP